MRFVFLTGAGALALLLGACDAGPSATSKGSANPPPSISAAGQSAQSSAGGSSGGVGAAPSSQSASATDPRDLPAPLASDGKPIWAANRKHTAQENADYQFGKNGKDFGALTEADYVAKVHAFVDRPPSGVQKVERSNGDDLLYDAKTNTFAVVTKAGAPRTMFKPRDGTTYWQQQVSRVQSQGNDEDRS